MGDGIDELFSRERLAGYDPAVLGSARVALIGAGALGQNAALCLALSGIGEVAIVDFDNFEESNRTRSPFFVSGQPKAGAVAEGWRRLATAASPRAWAFPGAVQNVGDMVTRWADVVLAAVDKPSARAYLAERCRLHRRPLVEAGFSGHVLSLSVFKNESQDEPCWRCGRGELRDSAARSLCSLYAMNVEILGGVPAVQSVAQTAGAVAAEAAIAALHRELPLAGRRVSLHVRSGRTVGAILPLDPLCPGIHAPLQEAPRLLDVRRDATVADLLAHLACHGPDPEVTLPSPFVTALPCARCGRSVPIERPRWAVTAAPVCTGSCPPGDDLEQPHPPVAILGPESRSLHSAPCASVGLGAGAVFSVSWANGGATTCRMPGELPAVFTPLAAPARAGTATEPPCPSGGLP